MLFLIILFSSAAAFVLVVTTPTSMTRQNSETVLKAEALRAALENYKLSHGGPMGAYPLTLDALVTTDGTPCAADNNPSNVNTYTTLQGWCGPYIDQKFAENLNDFKADGWGTVFQYNSGVLQSCGPDRTCGNADDQTFNP